MTFQQNITQHPSQFSIISQHSKPLPLDSERYIQLVERNGKKMPFNQIENSAPPIQTKKITVTCLQLELGENAQVSIFDQLNSRTDIKELSICADHLVISSPLKLPGTTITIWARKLSFVGNGHIDTSAKSINIRSDKTQAMNGQNGGNILLYVRDIDTPGNSIRFIANGAPGQDALLGQKGKPGTSVTPWSGKIDGAPGWLAPENLSWAREIAGLKWSPVIVHWWQLVHVQARRGSIEHGWLKNWLEPKTIGDKWPTDAVAPAKIPGKPGLGGGGGNIYSCHGTRLRSVTSQTVGSPGNKAVDLEAVKGGTPTKSCRLQVGYRTHEIFPHGEAGVNGNGIMNWKDPKYFVISDKRTSKSYPKYPAPDANPDPTDRSGLQKDLPTGNPAFWINSLTLDVLASYVRDAFRVGSPEVVKPLLDEYLPALEASIKWTPPQIKDAADGDQETLQLNLVLRNSELLDLVQRINGPNDFFGNPAGWIPGLSFQSNFSAFQNEIKGAVARLYLSYWMEHNQASKAARIESVRQAIEELQRESVKAEETYNSTLFTLKELAEEEAVLGVKIRQFVNDIGLLESELRRAATERKQSEHMFRTAGKILGGVAQIIPVGQPALGAVGQGLSAFANWEGNDPFDAITKIGAAVWDSKLVEDVVLPKAKERAGKLRTSLETTIGYERNSNSSRGDVPFDKELAKTQLSAKVKTHIARQSKAKDQVTSALGNLSVSKEELEAAVAKAIADCPEYQEKAATLQVLNAQKEMYRSKVLAAMQTLDNASNVVLTNHLTQIEVRASLADTASLLSAEALRYTRSMGARALDRLQRYQYYFAASYSYLRLESLTDFDANSEFMFTKLRDTLKTSKSAALKGSDFDRLAVVFEDSLTSVADKILTYHNDTRPMHDNNSNAVLSKITLELTDQQLAELNGKDSRVVIDPMALGKLHLSMEDIRIYDVIISHADLVDPPNKATDVRVRINHSGRSILRCSGEQYIFRGAAHRWGAVVTHAQGKTAIQPESPDPVDLSLIKHLLKGNSTEALFPRPSAWSQLQVNRLLLDMNSEYSAKFSALTLELHYTSRDVDTSKFKTLFVSTLGDVAAHITLNQSDISGRKDGVGNFMRTYHRNTKLTLTAAKSFGQHVFLGWRIRGQGGNLDLTTPIPILSPDTSGNVEDLGHLVTDTTIAINNDEDKLIYAIYVRPLAGGDQKKKMEHVL